MIAFGAFGNILYTLIDVSARPRKERSNDAGEPPAVKAKGSQGAVPVVAGKATAVKAPSPAAAPTAHQTPAAPQTAEAAPAPGAAAAVPATADDTAGSAKSAQPVVPAMAAAGLVKQEAVEGPESTESEEVKEAMKALIDQEKKMGSLRNKAQSLCAHLAALADADPTDQVTKALLSEMTGKSGVYNNAYLDYVTSVAKFSRGGTTKVADEIKAVVGRGAAHYKGFLDFGQLLEAKNA